MTEITKKDFTQIINIGLKLSSKIELDYHDALDIAFLEGMRCALYFPRRSLIAFNRISRRLERLQMEAAND